MTIRSTRWRWCLYGAAGGLALCLTDFLFAWRGVRLQPWVGAGAWVNLGYLLGSVLIGAGAGLLAGHLRARTVSDRERRSPHASQTQIKADRAQPTGKIARGPDPERLARRAAHRRARRQRPRW